MTSKSEALKMIVGDHLMMFGVTLVFIAMLSGVLLIYVGLFFSGPADILPVWGYRVVFVVVGICLFARGILFWMDDVGPYIKKRLK